MLQFLTHELTGAVVLYAKRTEYGLLVATRYDFILAMGDDTTDDDMFKALPVTAVTVKIGTASESARYNLPVQTDTLPFLQRMTDKSVVKAALKSCLKGQLSSAIDFLKRIINH